MDDVSSSHLASRNTTPTWNAASSLEQHPDYKAAILVWKITPPCILLLGGFGNIATVFVMRRIKDHNSAQHAILMALAVSDLAFLCTATTHGWLEYGFGVDLRLVHSAACKLLFWVAKVSGATSAWLVTCVTVQRTMAVLWPHRMRVMCTVRRTWIVIATLVLAACVLDSHVLVGIHISKENRCQTTPGAYRYFYVLIFSWVYSLMASVFPSVCLFVCDVILSVTLFKGAVAMSSSISAQAGSDISTGPSVDSRRKTSYRTTVMVLTISCAFLVLTLPMCVYLIWSSYIYRLTGRYPRTIPVVSLVHAATHQFWYLNSAVNFGLYCLTGTKFRQEFLTWICCCGVHRPSAPSVRETAPEATEADRGKSSWKQRRV